MYAGELNSKHFEIYQQNRNVCYVNGYWHFLKPAMEHLVESYTRYYKVLYSVVDRKAPARRTREAEEEKVRMQK